MDIIVYDIRADGSVSTKKIERSCLPPEFADAKNFTLAVQDKSGFPGHCTIFPVTVEELGVVDQSSEPIVAIAPTSSVHARTSPRPGTSTSCSTFAVEDFQETSYAGEKINSTAGADHESSFKWSHESTLLLIDSYRQHSHLFTSACLRKSDVWKKVAACMMDQGYTLSWEACEKKMRNLKYRYKIIMDSSSKTGRGRCKWEFMDAMTQLMAGDPAIHPVRLLGSLVPDTSTPTSMSSSTHSRQLSAFSRSATATLSSSSSSSSSSLLSTPVSASTTAMMSSSLLSTSRSAPAAATLSSSSQSASVLHSEMTPVIRRPKKRSLDTQKDDSSKKSKAGVQHELQQFFSEQRKFMQEAIDVMKETVEVARERNSLLRELTDALKKS